MRNCIVVKLPLLPPKICIKKPAINNAVFSVFVLKEFVVEAVLLLLNRHQKQA